MHVAYFPKSDKSKPKQQPHRIKTLLKLLNKDQIKELSEHVVIFQRGMVPSDNGGDEQLLPKKELFERAWIVVGHPNTLKNYTRSLKKHFSLVLVDEGAFLTVVRVCRLFCR